jgi:hypothetical protein
VQLKSNVFDFDRQALVSEQSLLDIFPGLIRAHGVQEIDGFASFGGIFRFDLPSLSHLLMIFLSPTQMNIELHTTEEGKVTGEEVVKNLRSLFKRK